MSKLAGNAVWLALLLVTGMQVAFAVDDPTRPPFLQSSKPVVKKLAPLKPLILNSILYAPDRRVVVINDKVLSTGEKVEDATVVEIASDHVVLLRRGNRVTMRISNGDVIKRRHENLGDVQGH